MSNPSEKKALRRHNIKKAKKVISEIETNNAVRVRVISNLYPSGYKRAESLTQPKPECRTVESA